MDMMTAEKSAQKIPARRRRGRPLSRRDFYHQRYVMRVAPDGTKSVGMLISRPADGDPWARWLVQPIGADSVLSQRVEWASVTAGEWFGAPWGSLSTAEVRTLVRWLRRELERDA
ncbi:hypothetical protein [Streptomyces sp. NPDC096033]|uniref:hypothetical protein n=1 Tax=Streptomyces sp. NPDC096033 TaxID=3366071 RepID=UPI0038145E2B